MQRPTLFALAALAATASAAIPPTNLLGYPPSSYPLVSAPTFTCLDGSRTLPSSRINDDFCDCPDGSDERGTSACSHLAPALTFHCLNPGYASADIPVSRVNDGICDCCDGADESALAATASSKCPDTCVDKRKAAEAHIASQLATIRAGVAARGALLVSSASARAAAAARASALGKEAAVQEAEITRLKAALAASEEYQSLVNAKAKQAWAAAHPAEAAEEAEREKAAAEAQEQLRQREAEEAAKKDEDPGEDLDKMLQDAMIANGLMDAPAADADAAAEKKKESDDELFFPYPKEYQPGFKEGADNDDDDDDEDDVNEATAKANAEIAALEAELESVTAAAAAGAATANEAGKRTEISTADAALIATAAEADLFSAIQLPETSELRTQLHAAEAALRGTSSARSTASSEAEPPTDARDAAFLALKDVCVSVPQAQYTYEACFYGNAAQKNTDAGPSSRGTSLGKMSAITWPADSTPNGPLPSTATATFKGGQSCWRGPQRSLTVTLRCGATTRALAVDEPATCEYTMVVETPAMCGGEQADAVANAAKGAFNEYHVNPPAVPAAPADKSREKDEL